MQYPILTPSLRSGRALTLSLIGGGDSDAAEPEGVVRR